MVHERGKRVWRASPHHAWTFDFQHKSQRYTGSTAVHNKREAEAVARREFERVVEHWYRQNPNGTTRRSKAQDMTFGVAVASYMDARGSFDRNHEETSRHLLMLCESAWIGSGTLCSEIDMVMLHKIVALRRRQPLMSRQQKTAEGIVLPQRQVWDVVDGQRTKRLYIEGQDREQDVILLSPAYVNRSTIDLIKRVLLFAQENNGVTLAPISWKKIRLPEADAEIVTLTFDEEVRLDHYLDKADGYGDLVRFALMTGMRLENLTSLSWRQIDFDSGIIHIVQKGGGGRRKVHKIWMDEAIEKVVKAQIGRHPYYVFVYRAKKSWKNPKNQMLYKQGEIYPITYWGFRSWWGECQKLTGLSHITPHSFRRTAASRLVRFSGSLSAAQKLLGHSDIRITAKHYAHFTPDHALEAQRKVRVATLEVKERGRTVASPSQTDHKILPETA